MRSLRKNRVYKTNFLIMLLILVYIFGQNILYLVPVSGIYNVIAYGILILLVGYSVIIGGKLRIEKSIFTGLMLSPLILSILASFVEVLLYNDASLITSIWRQTQWWIYGFAYFVFRYVLDQNEKAYDKLIHSFIVLAVIQLIIGITQYINSDFVFTYAPITKRLGSLRFYFPIVLMVFAYFWALNLFFNNKNRMIAIVVMVAVLFEAMFVQQFRSTLLGILISTAIGFMLWKKVSYKKIIIFIFVVMAAYIVYLKTPFLQASVKYILNEDKSLDVRHYLIDFILENAQKGWLFGNGWVSSPMAYRYASTPYAINMNWGVFAFADGGIFSIFYSYGIFGVLWVAVLWSCIFKKAFLILVKENNYLYFLFPIYQVATMYIDIHWYIHDQFFVMAMFCALLEYKTIKLKGRNVQKRYYG